MMNVLALGLVLTSLLTAGFFTPENQKKSSQEDDVIVKQGHRVVVVEFEKDDGPHTKVLISPPDSDKLAKEKLSEDVKVVKTEEEEKEIVNHHHGFRPRELVCDAFGKCKHKIASALGKTTGKVNEVEEEAKDTVTDAVGKVKDTVTHTAHQAFDKMRESEENVKDSVLEAKDKVIERASEIKEGAKEKAHGAIETAKDIEQEVEKNTKEEAKEALENAKHGVKEGQKELGEIIHHAREVGVDFFDYVFSPDRLTAVSGVLHLMGFGAAYGMCLWVTFGSSYVLSDALPRNQFAMVQSKIYPVYFKAMAYSVGMAMLGDMMNKRNIVGLFRGFDLLVSFLMIMVNLLYLEPMATKVMLARMKREKEEGKEKEGHAIEPIGRVVDSTAEVAGRGGGLFAAADDKLVRLSEKLQKLNSYSSFLNVLTLMSLTWHLVRLGQRLHT